MKKWINKKTALSLEISEDVWREVCSIADKAYPNEGGGVLIGSYDDSLKNARICRVFSSSKNTGARCTFTLEASEGNKFLRTIWEKLSGKQYYIGTWHSHPEGACLPSSLDDQTMFEVARNKKGGCARPILLIVAGNKINGWHAESAWVYIEEGQRLTLEAVK